MIKPSLLLLWITAIGLSFAGITIKYLYSQNQNLSTQLTYANITIETKDKTIHDIKNQLEKVHKLDHKLSKELNHANQKISALEHNIAAGTQRVFVKAGCPAPMSNQSPTASVVNERTCELNQEARQDYYRLRRALKRTNLQVTGLQHYIQALPAACVQGRRQENHDE